MSTSYANPGGTGDRTALITVTKVAALGGSSGVVAKLIDGAFGTSSANSIWVTNSQAAAMSFTFYFNGLSKLIQEAKWYQNGSSAQPGTWKWAGSDDNSSYTDLTTAFTLNGGSTGSVIGDLSANVTGYLYYKLYQVANSGGNDTPWLQEVEFKIDNAAAGGVAKRSFCPGIGL